jgi:tetratricopeptide (TPR) repeat protein
MKKLITCIFILLTGLQLSAQASGDLDSLKQKLQITSDSLKGPIYIEIANQYLKIDTSSRRIRFRNQLEALNYTMLALHNYSGRNDSLGLRTCFNSLSKIYYLQRKFVQAKWFVLQSNGISRQKNDIPNIITSLIELSDIKAEIKDYNLAMRDLNEALALSLKTKNLKSESAVQVGYAGLYRHMKEFTKATIAIKRHEFIDDSIQKDEIARLAKLNTRDSVQIKKQDSVIVKKKAYTSRPKKAFKPNSGKRIASL